MKKICKNILGVLAFFNANISFAVEKFEILPDLPDPLAYAVQPAEAATITETTAETTSETATETTSETTSDTTNETTSETTVANEVNETTNTVE